MFDYTFKVILQFSKVLDSKSQNYISILHAMECSSSSSKNFAHAFPYCPVIPGCCLYCIICSMIFFQLVDQYYSCLSVDKSIVFLYIYILYTSQIMRNIKCVSFMIICRKVPTAYYQVTRTQKSKGPESICARDGQRICYLKDPQSQIDNVINKDGGLSILTIEFLVISQNCIQCNSPQNELQ